MARKMNVKKPLRNSGNGDQAVAKLGAPAMRAGRAKGVRASARGNSRGKIAAFLELTAEYARRIADGDPPPKIAAGYTGTFQTIANSFNAIIDLIHMRSADIEALTKASLEGKLDTRADARKYTGENGKMMRGVNTMLDAILLPIGEGNRILAQISNGKIDELIAQTYKGDHEKMKQAVNNVATVLQVAAEGAGPPDRSRARRASSPSGARTRIPGRVCRHRARRQRHSGRRDYAAQCFRAVMWTGSARATFRRRSPTPTTATSTPSRTT